MRFDYGRIRQTISACPKRLLIGLGLIALPLGAVRPEVQGRQNAPKFDARTERLRTFLSSLHCPVANMASDFVRAADDNHLDWRLLPSISVLESGGGKSFRNNNIFGWANGNQAFSSVKAGIREVAYKLSRSPLYRGHDMPGKLHIYNPDARYAKNVLTVMNRIAPELNHTPYTIQAN
jgi:hypothetical protein